MQIWEDRKKRVGEVCVRGENCGGKTEFGMYDERRIKKIYNVKLEGNILGWDPERNAERTCQNVIKWIVCVYEIFI